MRMLIILLSVLFVSPALAGWTLVGKNEATTAYLYVPSDGIQKVSPDTIGVWMIFDNLNKDVEGASSYQSFREIDCLTKRTRSLQQTSYYGQMAKGKIITTFESPGNWSFAPPETLWSFSITLACDIAAAKTK